MPKADTPGERMGVYKTLGDVPDRHRLAAFSGTYKDREVWIEYLNESVLPHVTHEGVKNDVHRYGKYWTDHTNQYDTHHALATPEIANSYCSWLIEDKAPITACQYWYRIDDFYQWLLWHTDHPHRYNPIRIAATEYDDAGTLWEWQYQYNGGRDL